MDFINRSFEQLSELFRSMTPGGRITAGLLLAVVVVSIAFLMNTKVDGPDEYLLGGQSFSTEEISAMQVAFGKSGLSSFEVVGGQVRIPKSQQASYLAALADGDALPRNFGEYVTRALENSSMMTTSSDRQQLVHFAKIQDYSATIRKLPFVKGATIAYDPKRHSGFRRQPPTKATATVTPRGAGQLDDQQVLAIRSIVAGGFGLEPHDVIVVDTNGRIHNATRAGDVAAGVDNPYLKTQVAHENSFRDKIYEALDYIPGVHVTVNVKLDPTTRNVSEQVAMDPDSTIVLNSRSE
ncbi:MAG: hypothetical protein KDA63_06410, partial [Planctomycetales bacterium]|nr:hypothetical protein [Planctomycetales bacterium]